MAGKTDVMVYSQEKSTSTPQKIQLSDFSIGSVSTNALVARGLSYILISQDACKKQADAKAPYPSLI